MTTLRPFAAILRHGAILLALVCLCPARAQGQYIDPGSASLLWQLLVAGAVGLGFTMRHYLLALYRRLFSRRGKGPSQATGEHTDDA